MKKIPSDESLKVEKLKFKQKLLCLPTKRDSNYEILLVSTEEKPAELRVCDIEDDAEKVLEFLKKVLPKKIIVALHRKLANEISKRAWAERKRKKEFHERKKKEKYDSEKPDVVDEDTFAKSWRDEVPDWVAEEEGVSGD